jgi:acyl-CoA thioesterase
MSGTETMEYIKTMFNQCNVARLLGIEILEAREGFAKGRMTLRKEHISIFGRAHGGILFTLADHVGGVCGNSLGRKAILVESSIQYVKGPVEGDTVISEARLIHKGKKIGRIDITISEEGGDLLALMHMVFYISNEHHKPAAV